MSPALSSIRALDVSQPIFREIQNQNSDDPELDVRIELGRAQISLADVKHLNKSLLLLDRLADEPVDVFVNDRLAARGELAVMDDEICVRITEVMP